MTQIDDNSSIYDVMELQNYKFNLVIVVLFFNQKLFSYFVLK